MRFSAITIAATLLLTAASVTAEEVVLPHTFSDNTQALAREVNENFEALKNAIDALQRAAEDSYVVIDSNGMAVGKVLSAGGESGWRDTIAFQVGGDWIGAELKATGQVEGDPYDIILKAAYMDEQCTQMVIASRFPQGQLWKTSSTQGLSTSLILAYALPPDLTAGLTAQEYPELSEEETAFAQRLGQFAYWGGEGALSFFRLGEAIDASEGALYQLRVESYYETDTTDPNNPSEIRGYRVQCEVPYWYSGEFPYRYSSTFSGEWSDWEAEHPPPYQAVKASAFPQ